MDVLVGAAALLDGVSAILNSNFRGDIVVFFASNVGAINVVR